MVNWGILGAGNIANRFAESLAHDSDACLLAVSCRTQEKADRFAQKHSVQRAYDSHDKLLADGEIDAIYLALPHGLHKEWVVKALRAGKAVLCEKPAGLCADDVREMAETAKENRVLFMEAMKTRFVPLYGQIKELVERGEIGGLVSVEASLCNDMPFEAHGLLGKTYHTQPGQGGALLDGGIYCACWLEEYLKGGLSRTRVIADLKDSIDYYVDARLNANDVEGQLECAFDRAKERTAVLRGTTGEIRVKELHRTENAEVYRGGKLVDTLHAAYEVDDFYGEIRHFNRCLMDGLTESPIMPLSASIRCAEILDLIREGFSYDESDLAALEQQEETLRFSDFRSVDALALGNEVVRYAGEYDREVGIRIVRESDETVLFQYMMDSKDERNVGYMEGKRAAAKKCGHSSLWAYVDHAVHGAWQDMFDDIPRYMPCAGAFPIRVGNDWTATLMVSGLHEGQDHELIVRALGTILDVSVPEFTKMPV